MKLLFTSQATYYSIYYILSNPAFKLILLIPTFYYFVLYQYTILKKYDILINNNGLIFIRY